MGVGAIYTKENLIDLGYNYEKLGIWSSNKGYLLTDLVDRTNLIYQVKEDVDIDTASKETLSFIQRNIDWWDMDILTQLAYLADKEKNGFLSLWFNPDSGEILEELIQDMEEILGVGIS